MNPVGRAAIKAKRGGGLLVELALKNRAPAGNRPRIRTTNEEST